MARKNKKTPVQVSPEKVQEFIVLQKQVDEIGQILRDNRHKFLHQGIYDKFKGYAYAQVKKLMTKEADEDSKRAVLIRQYGYDAQRALDALEKANPGICEAYFSSQSAKLFAENPRLYSFGWVQYTPSWNDGDTCYFSAQTDSPDINGVGSDDLIYETEHDDEDYDKEAVGAGETPLPLTKEEAKVLVEKVVDFLNQFKQNQLEHWFGDGVRITVTRKGAVTESYDCGY